MVAVSGVAACASGSSGETSKEVDFDREIRPLLAENCYACHGPDRHEAKADLSLHTFEFATQPRK